MGRGKQQQTSGRDDYRLPMKNALYGSMSRQINSDIIQLKSFDRAAETQTQTDVTDENNWMGVTSPYSVTSLLLWPAQTRLIQGSPTYERVAFQISVRKTFVWHSKPG
jgi:hypothetical protein